MGTNYGSISVCEARIDNKVYWPSHGGSLEIFQSVYDKMVKTVGQTNVIMLVAKEDPKELPEDDCCGREGYVSGMFIYTVDWNEEHQSGDMRHVWDCILKLEGSEEKEMTISNPEKWIIKL